MSHMIFLDRYSALCDRLEYCVCNFLDHRTKTDQRQSCMYILNIYIVYIYMYIHICTYVCMYMYL